MSGREIRREKDPAPPPNEPSGSSAGWTEPQDPITALSALAISYHEVLLSFESAGFERDEAFALVSTAFREKLVFDLRAGAR